MQKYFKKQDRSLKRLKASVMALAMAGMTIFGNGTWMLGANLSQVYASENLLDISEYGPAGGQSPAANGMIIAPAGTSTTEASANVNAGTASSSGTSSVVIAAAPSISTTSVAASSTQETSAATPVTTASQASSLVASSVNLAKLSSDGSTASLGDTVNSDYAVLYDLDRHRIVAEKNSSSVIYPASMTKIMTLLVAVEHISNLDDKVTITQDIVDYVYKHDASNCGFAAGEQVTVRDLLYGVILPSGADAVMALSRYVAGGDEAFVALMNQKAKDLGLSANAHFVNATGLYHKDHHLTVRDMAEILNAAMANPTARTILTTPSYRMTATKQHPSGLSFSNLFLSRISGQDKNGVSVMAAKTGYISQSMYCAASYAVSANGRHYIAVTGHADSAWAAVYDHARLYKTYTDK